MLRMTQMTHAPIPRAARALAALALVAVAASGCSSLRSVAGLDKSQTPDEFQVVSRAPLAIPPDFGLRAPDPGAQRPQETSPTDRARQIVIDRQRGVEDEAPTTLAGLSPSESALLRQAGAASMNPNIRREVDRETTTLAQADKRWIDNLLFWKTPIDPGEIVDAEKESQRLRGNAALNRPVSEGETPSIKKKRTALFEF
jgi:hypothetical protein